MPDGRSTEDVVALLAVAGEALSAGRACQLPHDHLVPSGGRRQAGNSRIRAATRFNEKYGSPHLYTTCRIAALEAVALRQTLASGRDRLSQRYFKASTKIVDIAWDLAIGSDLSLPEVEGERPILTRLSNVV